MTGLVLQIARVMAAGLALLALAGCATSSGLRARWYVHHPREDLDAPADLYVLLENAGTKPTTVEAVHLNGREGRPLAVEWQGAVFKPGSMALAEVGRATKVGAEYRLDCVIPVRLFVRLEGKKPFGGLRWAEVPVDAPLPSSLPDEWLHCRTGPDDGWNELHEDAG